MRAVPNSRWLIFAGALLLIAGGFLPWISAPDLFGLNGTALEGIEVGWEGDGVVTTGLGLLIALGELCFGKKARKGYVLTGAFLAILAALAVLGDFWRIIEINPPSGFFAAADIGLYGTLGGALTAWLGYIWKWFSGG